MEIPRITPEEVRERIGRGERIAFVDSRSAKAYQDAVEQIPASTRIPPDDVDSRVSQLPHNATIVAYCT